jgi:hypothetical protein
VETELSVKVADFNYETDIPPGALTLSADEAEEIVRTTGAILTDGSVQVASLHYVDPLRFGIDDPSLAAGIGLASSARIIPQNMSVSPRKQEATGDYPVFEEDLLEVTSPKDIGELLDSTGYGLSNSMAEAIETLLKAKSLKSGHAIRLGLQETDEGPEIVRASVYDGSSHELTIALNDRRQYVPAPEPDGFRASWSDRATTGEQVPVPVHGQP